MLQKIKFSDDGVFLICLEGMIQQTIGNLFKTVVNKFMKNWIDKLLLFHHTDRSKAHSHHS